MLWEISGRGSRPQLEEEEERRMLASQLLVFSPGRTWSPWLLVQKRKREDSGEIRTTAFSSTAFFCGISRMRLVKRIHLHVCLHKCLVAAWINHRLDRMCCHHQNLSEIGRLLVAVGQIWVSGTQQTKPGGKLFSWEHEGGQDWRSAMLFQVGVLSLVC